MKELQEMRRQQASSIVIPEAAPPPRWGRVPHPAARSSSPEEVASGEWEW